MLTTEMKELLKQKAPELIEKVKPTNELWASLVKHKVIADVFKDDIKVGCYSLCIILNINYYFKVNNIGVDLQQVGQMMYQYAKH